MRTSRGISRIIADAAAVVRPALAAPERLLRADPVAATGRSLPTGSE